MVQIEAYLKCHNTSQNKKLNQFLHRYITHNFLQIIQSPPSPFTLRDQILGYQTTCVVEKHQNDPIDTDAWLSRESA